MLNLQGSTKAHLPSIKAHFLICSTLPFISCFPRYVLNRLTDLKYIENDAKEQENARFQETLGLLIHYKVEYFFFTFKVN